MENYKHPTNYSDSKLLTIDRSGSVLNLLVKPFSYSCFGYLPAEHGLSVLLAFNALPLELSTGCYLPGNGRRVYNPVLMRFQSADALSPFEVGGLNAYGYCEGDPINWQDKSGQARTFIQVMKSYLGGHHSESVKPTPPTPPNTPEPSRAGKPPTKKVTFSETATLAVYEVKEAPNVERDKQHATNTQNKLKQAESLYFAHPTTQNKLNLGKAVQEHGAAATQLKNTRKTTPPLYTSPVTYQEHIRIE